AQTLGLVTPDAFFLAITFLTLAMLVVGGISSLSGAVVGTIAISALAEILRRFEQGIDIGPVTADAPSGLREVGFAAVMLLILVLRPTGIVGGRELAFPSLGTPLRRAPPVVAPPSTPETPPVSRDKAKPVAQLNRKE
ncbi:MAG: branched-chain amino acid ABC transporter permease, partial [Gaiellaceae bacterium]